MLAGVARFARDLISKRMKSALAAAKARGKKFGREPEQRQKWSRAEGPSSRQRGTKLPLDRA
ncbi:MAG: hypothetical protein OXH79_12180 [Boseongicola sp.]|nr:hypothetical protein [Boseongicola sp.]